MFKYQGPLIISIFVFFILAGISSFTFISSLRNNQILGATQNIPKSTTLSTTVGVFQPIEPCEHCLQIDIEKAFEFYRFKLFGYSSPGALVNIQGMGIFDQTYAKDDGYFEFNSQFSPFSPREVCLFSRDKFGRLSNPLCIPPFPTDYDVIVGPVILPPTLSFDKNDYFLGDEIILSGQSIPNTELDFAVFIDEKRSFINYFVRKLNPIKSTYALTFPNLKTASDENGNFSLSLPSSNPEFFRVFAQTSYDNNLSPKSNTLNLNVLPIWMIIIKFFLFLFSLLKTRLLEILILAQILALFIYFVQRHLHPYHIAKNRSIMLRSHFALVCNNNKAIVLKNNQKE